jgi:anoctamin-10
MIVNKRFCFEATDCYLVLLFLAFYEQDVMKVRSELVSVFHVDTFRRILLEGIIPYLIQHISDKRGKDENVSFKKTDGGEGAQHPLNDEASKEEYEQFDDYIEMIIQLGYITLFAAAYPLAPCVALIANLVEMRLDMFKITFITRRPRSIPTSIIGMWKTLIRVIVWGSAITNCLIFTFSSMQMVQWLPDYFPVDSEGEHNLKAGSGWVVIFIVFGIERLACWHLNWAQ